MTQIKDGGHAFPVNKDYVTHSESFSGMSLRDWFAGQALAGLLAQTPTARMADSFASEAYCCADAMLAEREKVKP